MTIIRKNYRWVPSLYLMQSIPFALVNGAAPILYKNLNYSNIKIAFLTSLFAIPWFCKPLLAPLFETLTSKRNLILSMQSIMVSLILLLAASLYMPNSYLLTGLLFMLLAFVSSIHDMNADGLYILSLDAKMQAYFIGVRTLFYQIGRFLIQGALIFLVGFLITRFGGQHIWQINLSILALLIGLITVYHAKFLPKTESSITKNSKETIPIKTILKELSSLPYLTATLIFVLFYNLPESALLKIVPLFLLDNHDHGGAGLTTETVGSVFGVIGIGGMLLGVFISGLLVKKYGLKKCLTPITCFTALSNLVYLLISIHPHLSTHVISLFIFIAQLGYGLSNGAYMLFLLYAFGKGTYPMSQYAIGTSLMFLGVALGGALSGYLQYLLGYTHFFITILGAGLMITLLAWYTSQNILKRDQYEIK